MKPLAVLAFSGGLDTSFLVPYVKEQKGVRVLCVYVNVGGANPEQLKKLVQRGKELGAEDVLLLDAREKYFDEVLSYLIKGNVLRGGTYPLCVGAERVIQAKELVRVAKENQSKIIVHGSTSAGNDQVRFEVYLRTLSPEIEVWAPVRDEGFKREDEIQFLRERGFLVSKDSKRFSINAGLWGKTIGSREMGDSSRAVPEDAFSPIELKSPQSINIQFEKGLPVSLNGEKMSSVKLIQTLSDLASPFGIGRGLHVGNTVLGIKGRVGFEAPAASILLEAHRELEKLIQTKWEQFWKSQLSQFYGDLLHEGQYFDPVMREIEAFIDQSQQRVTGWVQISLKPERATVQACDSPFSLLRSPVGTYGEESLSWNGRDTQGFAKILAIPGQLWNSLERNR